MKCGDFASIVVIWVSSHKLNLLFSHSILSQSYMDALPLMQEQQLTQLFICSSPMFLAMDFLSLLFVYLCMILYEFTKSCFFSPSCLDLRNPSAGDKSMSQCVYWTQLQELAAGVAQLPLSDQEQPQPAHRPLTRGLRQRSPWDWGAYQWFF